MIYVLEMMNFIVKNDELWIRLITLPQRLELTRKADDVDSVYNFSFKMMSFALKMMICSLNMMSYFIKNDEFSLKMMRCFH